MWSTDKRKGHSYCPTWRSIPYAVAKTRFYCRWWDVLVMGAWYGYLPKFSVRIWKIKNQMVTAKPLSERGVHDARVIEGTEGADVVYSPTEGETVSTSQNIPCPQAPRDRTPHSGQGLAMTIWVFIFHNLTENFRRYPYHAPIIRTSQHLQYYLVLATTYRTDVQVGQSLNGLSFCLCSTFCPHNTSWDYSVPSSTMHGASALWSYFFSFIWSLNWIYCILWTFWLISTYQWVHTMCILLWLCYLTQDNIFKFLAFTY